MSEVTNTETALFSVSESAAKRVKYLLSKESNPNLKLRVSVKGGGCSGFQYGFGFDDQTNDDDIVVERNGAVVLVDSISLLYLTGSELDFVEDIIGSFFRVQNPNATASCGCGESFAV